MRGRVIAADTDAVADRTATAEHVIELCIRRIDNDRARRLLGLEGNLLPAQARLNIAAEPMSAKLRARKSSPNPSIRLCSTLAMAS